MEGARGVKTASASSSSASTNPTISVREDYISNPGLTAFDFMHGRRYIRDRGVFSSYPLPCDAPEIHRQNLHTHLASQVFGRALCSPFVEKTPPQRVLEIACGTGYWSSLCHDYLAELGCLNVEFVGLDIVHLAPNLNRQGMNWRFVQHDVRKIPLPFDDEQFDLVLLKDLSLVAQIGSQSERLFDDAIRVLRSGGVLEIWESDHVVRSLLPHPPALIGDRREDHECATRTATFLISPATPFAKTQNKFLASSNDWIQEALDRRQLSPTPCARMQPMLLQEPETLQEIGYRRIAIPFGELRWERDDPGRFGAARGGKMNIGTSLTPEQSDLRSTALLLMVMFIESMEPRLKEASGKNQEEWQRWWNWMMADLYSGEGTHSGDCMEIGAYWARKK